MPKSPEQKIMELEAKVKLLEKQKSFLEQQAYVVDKKAIIFDMMIDIAEQEYQIDIRKKLSTRTIDHFRQKEQQTIVFACYLFGIDRQVYYRKIKRKISKQSKAEQVVSMVIEIRKSMSRLGTRKLYYLLSDKLQLMNIGRDKFFDILRANHLLIQPKRSYHITTNSHHRFRKHQNQILDLETNRPEQVWVSDITYIGKREKPCYLSIVTDAYSKKIMGHYLADNLNTESSLRALKTAIKQRKNKGLSF